MGDFNFPDIDWANLTDSNDNSIFLDTVMVNFFNQHISFHTRENNILDLFITSDPKIVNKVDCVGKLGRSDYNLLDQYYT